MIGAGSLTMKGNSVLSITGGGLLNTAKTWAIKSFVSLFRAKASNAFSKTPGLRGYVNTRGFLISKYELNSIGGEEALWQSGYMFQFNPNQLQDVKSVAYETRSYAGMPYIDYIWTGGGERTISFSLFIDDTPQSHTSFFRPETFGSKRANELKVEKGKKTTIWQKAAGELGINLSKAPDSLEWTNNGAYSNTRIHERGTLDAVERITQYLYPARQWKYGRTQQPAVHFSTGGVVEVQQFRPPSIVVFSFGNNYYLEGIIKSAEVTHSLFDSDLTPIRSTVAVTFGVIDVANVTPQTIKYPEGTTE